MQKVVIQLGQSKKKDLSIRLKPFHRVQIYWFSNHIHHSFIFTSNYNLEFSLQLLLYFLVFLQIFGRVQLTVPDACFIYNMVYATNIYVYKLYIGNKHDQPDYSLRKSLNCPAARPVLQFTDKSQVSQANSFRTLSIWSICERYYLDVYGMHFQDKKYTYVCMYTYFHYLCGNAMCHHEV